MLGGKKKSVQVSPKSLEVEYNAFDVHGAVDKAGVLSASESVNCDGSDGALKTGLGVRPWASNQLLTFPFTTSMTGEPRSFFFFRTKMGTMELQLPGYITVKGYCYTYTMEQMGFVSRVQSNKRMEAHVTLVKDENGLVDRVLVFTEKNLFALTDSTSEFATVGLTSCSTVIRGRVVACIAPHTLVYSAPYEPLKLTDTICDSGRIYLSTDDGEPVAMKGLGEDLYIFRERGIQRVRLEGAANDFKVERVEYHGGRIRGTSVGVFGDKIIFLATDGVYFFDGKKAEKKFLHMRIKPKVLQRSEEQQIIYACAGGVADGKYLLRYHDEAGERTAVLYPDGVNGYFTQAYVGLSSCESALVCYANNYISEVCAEGNLLPNCRYWFQSKAVDLGVKSRKLLKNVCLAGTGELDLTVTADGREQTVRVKLKEEGVAVDLMMRGQTFQFAFALQKNAELRQMRLQAVCL